VPGRGPEPRYGFVDLSLLPCAWLKRAAKADSGVLLQISRRRRSLSSSTSRWWATICRGRRFMSSRSCPLPSTTRSALDTSALSRAFVRIPRSSCWPPICSRRYASPRQGCTSKPHAPADHVLYRTSAPPPRPSSPCPSRLSRTSSPHRSPSRRSPTCSRA